MGNVLVATLAKLKQQGVARELTLPGQAPKKFHFLLYHTASTDWVVRAWHDALVKLGYGGSTLAVMWNFRGGYALADTGELNAIFYEAAGSASGQGDVIDRMYAWDAVRRPRSPGFNLPMLETSCTREDFEEILARFLRGPCPLS